MCLENNKNTPPELIQKALKACAKVDDLETTNASLEEIEEAEEAVRQISQLISQFYQMQAGISTQTANNNELHKGDSDDDN